MTGTPELNRPNPNATANTMPTVAPTDSRRSHAVNPDDRCDRLILLMGGNPLPNWVAAVSLLRSGGTVFLLHSKFSDNASHKLEATLLQQASPASELPVVAAVERVSLGDEHDNPDRIQQAIRSLVQREPDMRWGLNYTGGTKTMSVHSYRTLAALQPDAVLSYLDATRGQLAIERPDAAPTRVQVTPPLSLEALFQLHGNRWQADRPPQRAAIQVAAARRMAQALQVEAVSNQWRQWRVSVLHPATKDRRTKYWKQVEQIDLSRSLPLGLAPPALGRILREHFGAAHGLDLSRFAEWGFHDPIELCAWLDGVWLEHIVLATLQQQAETLGLCDTGLGFNIADPNSVRGWDKFELDVAATRGYHFVGLSCTTTASKKLCKQKLIEVAQRSMQLGGSEARFALVCGYHRPDWLRSELETLTRNSKIAVFGRGDWLRLDRCIAQWLAPRAARSPRPTPIVAR